MDTYTLRCTANTSTAQQYAGEIKGTLEEITNRLIEINDQRGRGADLSADYWPYLYWSTPGAYTLDHDEPAPEKPSYTHEVAKAIAASVWDESPQHITLTED